MKYTTYVDIAAPRLQVAELFSNPANYTHWQESLVSQEFLDGTPGQVGAKSNLLHKMGKREIEMLETITHRDLPDMFTATYEADGVWNEAQNRFTELEDGSTRWEMDTEFRCTGMMWWMTTLMPWMFKKQTQATMDAFKAFVEKSDTKDTP